MGSVASNNPVRSGKPRWHRRLSLRLAILLAVTLLAYEFFGPYVYQSLFHWLGLPGPHDVIHLVPAIDDPKMMLTVEDVMARDLMGQLFDGEEEVSADVMKPSADAIALVSASLAPGHEGFAWLDGENRIVTLSEWLPWSVGEPWPFEFHSHSDVFIAGEPEASAHLIYARFDEEPAVAGTFVLLLLTHDDAGDALDEQHFCDVTVGSGSDSAGEPIIMDPAEAEASERKTSQVSTALGIAISSVIALLLAYAISRLVTRRLTRLATQASTPLGETGSLPGPFDDAGHDEIALLARSMNAMRARVAELLDGLAEQDVQRRGWVAQVSHDLRTPLTALIACLDRADIVMENADPATLKTQMRELLAVARMDADRVQALSSDLFEIARLDAHDALTLEPVPPGELLRQAVRGLGPLAELRRVQLVADVSQALPVLTADGGRLMRGMENLLRNAVDHAQREVTALAEPCDGGVRFEVRDDGRGLPEQGGEIQLDALNGRRSRSDSAGLGLVVTRKVAEAHGGTLGARNLDSGGAAVWFTIPCEPSGCPPLGIEGGTT